MVKSCACMEYPTCPRGNGGAQARPISIWILQMLTQREVWTWIQSSQLSLTFKSSSSHTCLFKRSVAQLSFVRLVNFTAISILIMFCLCLKATPSEDAHLWLSLLYRALNFLVSYWVGCDQREKLCIYWRRLSLCYSSFNKLPPTP